MDMDMAWGVVDAACRNAAPAFCQDYLTHPTNPRIIAAYIDGLVSDGSGRAHYFVICLVPCLVQ